MTEISSLSIQGVNSPQNAGMLQQQGLTDLSGGGIFGDNLIGGVGDSYASDSMKDMIKSQAQELVKLAKRVGHSSEDSESSSSIKKSIGKKLKALQEQAKNAKIDLNEIFSEIATEMNMNKKDQKLIQKTLHVKISKNDGASSETSQNSGMTQLNPFGSSSGRSLFPSMDALLASSTGASSDSPVPTANPSYSRTPSRKLDKDFLDKTKAISERIGCDYKDLLAVMNSESGLNSAARNPKGGATGLIQFMPQTAKMLGTTTDELAKMSPTQQLDYVEKFFNVIKKQAGMEGKKLSGADLYSLVFLPGRANRSVLTQQGENFYSYNKGLDLDKNGDISKQDLARRVASCYVDESKVFA